MIFYTPYPIETFFYDATQRMECHTVEWNGVPMVVQWDATQGATIMQLLSPDPQHYLDPRLQPGSQIDWVPRGSC